MKRANMVLPIKTSVKRHVTLPIARAPWMDLLHSRAAHKSAIFSLLAAIWCVREGILVLSSVFSVVVT